MQTPKGSGLAAGLGQGCFALTIGKQLVYMEYDGAVNAEREHCSVQVPRTCGSCRTQVIGGQSMGVL